MLNIEYDTIEFRKYFYMCNRVVAVDLRGCGESDKPQLRTNYSRQILVEDLRGLAEALLQQGEEAMPRL